MATTSGKRKDSARRKRRELEQARSRRGRTASVSTDLGDVDATPAPLPRWYKAVMFGLLILGLLWIVVYYLSQGLFPIPDAGGWNILIGFGIALVGFLMMSRWSE
ncbi:cell division protein CrgA [Micrococcus porci]|uniref:cell division protein CrgA n=1 Tax=Micrococcus porci TaxID=2856555 RepID=UPI001CCE57C3|nr:cell division protein CrgA [Micrococcus porci]UBH24960.1 cell division protein CrgA [Micrococcus porci]